MAASSCIVQYSETCQFPIQNLPYGVFFTEDNKAPRVGVAIGDRVFDCCAAADAGLFDGPLLAEVAVECFSKGRLNEFMSLGPSAWAEARVTLIALLSGTDPRVASNSVLQAALLVPQALVTMCLPAEIGDYTDFYASRNHATNVGTMFRGKDNALQENWLHLPVGYHGRSSSVVVSGTPIKRPCGQTLPKDATTPVFGTCKLLDIELEVGVFVGVGNDMGAPIPAAEAEQHLFGMVLLNDWSARDIQKWEYVPLGPFLGKNFGTTISPWVVTMAALEPFKCAAEPQVPTPLPYLRDPDHHVFDIHLEVHIKSAAMADFYKIVSSNAKHLYWSFGQMLAHHSINGCPMRPGDLLGSGTISAPEPSGYGSMLELSWQGQNVIRLPSGEERKFLADGDTINLTGFCQGAGFRVGFGDCLGVIVPATLPPWCVE